MSIRRYCRIFLRSFDAHFFVFYGGVIFEFGSFIDSFEPKFPAVFVYRSVSKQGGWFCQLNISSVYINFSKSDYFNIGRFII